MNDNIQQETLTEGNVTLFNYLETDAISVPFREGGEHSAMGRLLTQANKKLREGQGWQLVGNPFAIGDRIFMTFVRMIAERTELNE